jgi:hypothetical protein
MASTRDTTAPVNLKPAGKRKPQTTSPSAKSSKRSRVKVMSQALTVSEDNDSDFENLPSLRRSQQSGSVVGTAASQAINVDDSGFSDSDPDGDNYSIVRSKPSRAISPPSQEPQQPRSEIHKIPSVPITRFALSAKQAQIQHASSTSTSRSFVPLDAASVRRGIQEGGSTSSRAARPKNGMSHEVQFSLLILTILYVLISCNVCLRGDSLLPAP